MEECFLAAKDQVGLDHYQVRRYDAWYRHTTLVLVAQGSWRRSAPRPPQLVGWRRGRLSAQNCHRHPVRT